MPQFQTRKCFSSSEALSNIITCALQYVTIAFEKVTSYVLVYHTSRFSYRTKKRKYTRLTRMLTAVIFKRARLTWKMTDIDNILYFICV